MDGQVIVDVILVILLVGGFIVYFRAKKQLRAGNRSGWLKWAEPYVSVTRSESRTQSTAAVPAPDVLGALDELYREFVDETAEIRREFNDQLEQLRRELDGRLAEQAARFSAARESEVPSPLAQPPQPAQPVDQPPGYTPEVGAGQPSIVSMPEPNPAIEPALEPVHVALVAPEPEPPIEQTMAHRRFEILELLVQGMSETEIARKLGIGVTEVKLVQQLLKQPR